VVYDADLARSPLVLSFLELSEAVRLVPHAASPSTSQPRDKLIPVAPGPVPASTREPRAPEEAHIIAQQSQSLPDLKEGEMRLGFRIEQRVHLKKHIQLLREHLDRAMTELHAAG
jgi:hypothetical protein